MLQAAAGAAIGTFVAASEVLGGFGAGLGTAGTYWLATQNNILARQLAGTYRLQKAMEAKCKKDCVLHINTKYGDTLMTFAEDYGCQISDQAQK